MRVSLETFIRAVLIGLAVGDTAGGLAVDRVPSAPSYSPEICFLAGLFIVLSIPIAVNLRAALLDAPVMLKAVAIAKSAVLLPYISGSR